jgi:hypothetical protein
MSTVYHNIPPFGSGAAGTLVPATSHFQQAKDRSQTAKE